MKQSSSILRHGFLGALFAAVLLLTPLGHGQTVDQTADTSTSQTQSSGSTSGLAAFWAAVADWFANLSGRNSGSTDSATAESAPAVSDAPSMDASASADSNSGPAVGVNPDALAQVIAQDSGGHADQYKVYADKLATTLAAMTPAERARIFR